jgi:SAM-dependent methyltransferase
MRLLDRLFSRRTPPPSPTLARDPWFWSHYDDAASIVLSLVGKHVLSSGQRAVDFGCGDGITACGVASRTAADIFGVDLYRTFGQLPSFLEKNLGAPALPGNLHFRQNEAGQPLPFPDAFADLVYSWSVFEHLSDASQVLGELGRILKPGATLFIQVEPLFYSPFGSHLQRLVAEPWAHLLHPEEEYLGIALAAEDHVEESERDTMYLTNTFDGVKRQLVEEYRQLNRITVDELAGLVRERGFEIVEDRRFRVEGLSPAQRLLDAYPSDVLLTNQIVIIATRKGASG